MCEARPSGLGKRGKASEPELCGVKEFEQRRNQEERELRPVSSKKGPK